MQIFIKTPNGKTLLLNVESSNDIQSIKNKIEEIEGIPSNIQRLIYFKELENKKTLSDYNIQNESTIQLLLNLKSNLTIFVKTLSETIKITLSFSNTTVRNIKEMITHINPEYYQLIYKERILEDSEFLYKYGVENNSILYLIEKKIKITIITLYNRKFVIYLNYSDTVLKVKNLIYLFTGIHINNQILIYKRLILYKDYAPISKYNIIEGDSLFLFNMI